MSEHSTYVGGFGPLHSKLAVIGIAPAGDEVLAGRPFVGPSGRILRQDLREAGINPEEVYMSNVFKYKLPNNEFKRYQEIGLSIKDALVDLQEEINATKPNCILGLGDPVLASLTGKSGKNNGINVWRGSILNYNGTKAVFTWHPAAELHGQGEGQWKSWQRYVRKFDVARAVKESNYSDFRLPQRLLHVARSSTDVYRFIERFRQEEFCAVDIEAIENIPICIGLSFKHYEGFCIPLWNNIHIQCHNEPHPKKSYSYNLKVSTIPSTDLAFIWQQLAELFLNPRIKFIGQNFKLSLIHI